MVMNIFLKAWTLGEKYTNRKGYLLQDYTLRYIYLRYFRQVHAIKRCASLRKIIIFQPLQDTKYGKAEEATSSIQHSKFYVPSTLTSDITNVIHQYCLPTFILSILI